MDMRMLAAIESYQRNKSKLGDMPEFEIVLESDDGVGCEEMHKLLKYCG